MVRLLGWSRIFEMQINAKTLNVETRDPQINIMLSGLDKIKKI